MSLSTATLVAPPSVVVVPMPDGGAARPQAAETRTLDARQATPFTRPPADNVGGWLAGLLFGLLCIVAAFAFLTTIAVVALAGVVGRGIATLADGRPRPVRAGRPVLA